MNIMCIFKSFVFVFSYILRVPFDNEESSGIVYLWIGSKANPDEVRLAEEICDEMFNNVRIIIFYSIHVFACCNNHSGIFVCRQ